MPNSEYAQQAAAYLEQCISDQDSSGGLIECIIEGMPAGVGEPVFDKLDASLAKAVMSIGAVKGVEIGDGFSVTSSKGSINNDSFISENGQVLKQTNHSGGFSAVSAMEVPLYYAQPSNRHHLFPNHKNSKHCRRKHRNCYFWTT